MNDKTSHHSLITPDKIEPIVQDIAKNYGGKYYYSIPTFSILIDDLRLVIGRDYKDGTWTGMYYVHGYVDSRFSGIGHSIGCGVIEEIYPAAEKVIRILKEKEK